MPCGAMLLVHQRHSVPRPNSSIWVCCQLNRMKLVLERPCWRVTATSNSWTMALLALMLILALCCCIETLPTTKDEYLEMREELLDKEYQMRIGGTVNLSDAELRVNTILMNFKCKELEIARRNITNFPPAVHFFRAKELIDKSEVFRIIRSMPKGILY